MKPNKRRKVIQPLPTTPALSPLCLSLKRLLSSSVNLTVKVARNEVPPKQAHSIPTLQVININPPLNCCLCGDPDGGQTLQMEKEDRDLLLFLKLMIGQQIQSGYCSMCSCVMSQLLGMKRKMDKLEKRISNVVQCIRHVIRLKNKERTLSIIESQVFAPNNVEEVGVPVQTTVTPVIHGNGTNLEQQVISPPRRTTPRKFQNKKKSKPIPRDPLAFSESTDDVVEPDPFHDPLAMNESGFFPDDDLNENEDVDVKFEDVKPDIAFYEGIGAQGMHSDNEEGMDDGGNYQLDENPLGLDDSDSDSRPTEDCFTPKPKSAKRKQIEVKQQINRRNRKKRITHYYVNRDAFPSKLVDDVATPEQDLDGLRKPRQSKVKAQQIIQTLNTKDGAEYDVNVAHSHQHNDEDGDYSPDAIAEAEVIHGMDDNTDNENDDDIDSYKGIGFSAKKRRKRKLKKASSQPESPDSGPYTCSLCSEQFNFKRSLSLHKNRVHGGTHSFPCTASLCGRRFLYRKSLQTHLMKCHKQPVTQNDAGEEELQKEEVVKSNRYSKHKCRACTKIFPTRLACFNHKRKVHEMEHKMECPSCKKRFFYAKFFANHVRSCNSEAPPPSLPISNDNWTVSANTYKCTICEKSYRFKKKLEGHIRIIHQNQNPIECNICNRRFYHTTYYKMHMARHDKAKAAKDKLTSPYNCDICGKHFHQSGSLRKHVLSVHEGKREYVCERCGKALLSLGDLQRHLRSHDHPSRRLEIRMNAVLKEKCDICQKMFSSKGVLYGHKRSVHEQIKRFSCEVCAKGFYRLPDCTRHEKTMHKYIRNDVTTQQPPPTKSNSNDESSSTALPNSNTSALNAECENRTVPALDLSYPGPAAPALISVPFEAQFAPLPPAIHQPVMPTVGQFFHQASYY